MKRIISFIKRNLLSIFWLIVFFFTIYFCYDRDAKNSFQYTLFVFGYFYIINTFNNYFVELVKNDFSFKKTGSPKDWLRFVLGIGSVIALFLIFLPYYLLVMSKIMIPLLIFGLAVYNSLVRLWEKSRR